MRKEREKKTCQRHMTMHHKKQKGHITVSKKSDTNTSIAHPKTPALFRKRGEFGYLSKQKTKSLETQLSEKGLASMRLFGRFSSTMKATLLPPKKSRDRKVTAFYSEIDRKQVGLFSLL